MHAIRMGLLFVNVVVMVMAVPRCFGMSVSQPHNANPYYKMAFSASKKAKNFPAAQPWWAAGCAVTGVLATAQNH